MNVLLLTDVIKVGTRGDIVNVADGFGRNYLIARGLARVADTEMIRRAKETKTARKAIEAAKKDVFLEQRKKLSGGSLTIKRKANYKGGLFGAVARHDITLLLHKEGYRFIHEDDLEGLPLKTIGDHTIYLKVGSGDAIPFHIVVEPL